MLKFLPSTTLRGLSSSKVASWADAARASAIATVKSMKRRKVIDECRYMSVARSLSPGFAWLSPRWLSLFFLFLDALPGLVFLVLHALQNLLRALGHVG